MYLRVRKSKKFGSSTTLTDTYSGGAGGAKDGKTGDQGPIATKLPESDSVSEGEDDDDDNDESMIKKTHKQAFPADCYHEKKKTTVRLS